MINPSRADTWIVHGKLSARGLAFFGAAVPLLIVSAWEAPASVAGPRVSPASAAALLKRSQQTYTHVPGVVISIHGAGMNAEFIQGLTRGTVTSEAYVGHSSAGTTTLVSTDGSPTYAKEPGTSCWRALARSAPQTLTDVGQPELYLQGAKVVGSRAVRTGWTLTLHASGSIAVMSIDNAFFVQSITITQGKQRALESFATLDRAPRLPNAQPRCA